jgi:diguanylate cyclase (GGDEF)-like protein
MKIKISQVPAYIRRLKQSAKTCYQQSLAVVNQAWRKTRMFNRRQNGSLVRRIQLLLLVWGLFVYIIAVSGFWFVSTSVIETTLKHQTSQWVEKIDNLSTPLYISGKDNEFSVVEEYVSSINEIVYVNFYESVSLSLLASYKSDQLASEVVPQFSASKLDLVSLDLSETGKRVFDNQTNKENIVRIIRPVSIASMQADDLLDFDLDNPEKDSITVIGYIDIGIDYSVYQAGLVENIVKASLSILVVFLLALVVGRMLIKKALRPLLDLREPLERLARGDTDVWVKKEGDVEIVAISNALSTTISAIRGRDAELRRLVDFDPLTGLFNKRSFNALFEKECQRSSGKSGSCALFFIDLDQFKYVNDSLGHAAGDRLLIDIARLLKKRLRAKDVVSRFGGDEFAVLAKSVDKLGATEMASAIVKEVGDYLFVEKGKTFRIGCSIGVVLVDSKAYSAEELFAHADMACYSAKSQGRNRYHLYEAALADKNKIDIGWSQRITRALNDDDFELHFQPIIQSLSQQTVAYEVLLRLIDEQGGYILPGSFLPVAERFGLAAAIDYWVIEKTIKLIQDEAAQSRFPRFHINISTQILSSPDFVERLLSMTEGGQLDVGQIVFEITEQAAVMNINSSVSQMTELKSHGFSFAIDKFGSGFNSFSYLRHMPVDYVKVSGEFIETMIEDDVDRAMVKAIIDIAKACDKEVIAEYVPGKNSLDILRSFGVDYVQGNFIAEPRNELVSAVFDAVTPASNITSLPLG